MPKSPNAAALTKITTALGTEPLLIIEVDWDGTPSSYADKDFLGIRGKILSVSGLDSATKLGSTGAGGSLGVTLSDTDGSIKTFWNTVDIHKRAARVYQIYEGLVETDKFLLFSGQVSSPIDWDEGARTISFDIVSVIEDKQLGFSPEQGEFDFIAESAVGVPWPLAFGDVIRVPAVKITEAVRGTSLTQFGALTIPELDQLCGLAVSLQQAETAKKIADGQAGFLDTNYAVVIDNLTSATISLNTTLAGFIFDSPDKESAMRQYIDVCKELERWRLFYKENLDKFIDAENRITPLQTSPAKPAISGLQFYHPRVTALTDRNLGQFLETQGIDLSRTTPEELQEIKTSLSFGATASSFFVDQYPARPAVFGAVDQALEALNDWRALYYPYAGHVDASKLGPGGTPPSELAGFCTATEETATDVSLSETYSDLQGQLNDALGDSTAASAFMSLANANTSVLLVEKASLEDTITTFTLETISIEGGENFPQGSSLEIIINGMYFHGSFAGRIFTVSQINTPADLAVAVTQSNNSNEFFLADPTVQLKGKYCFFAGKGLTFVENQDGDLCTISPILYRKTGTVDDGTFSHDIYDPRFLSGLISETGVFIRDQWLSSLRADGTPDYATGLSNLKVRDYAIEIGDDVFLATDYVETYIANLIPSTAVHEVMAFRDVDGTRKLLPVPSRYFDVNLNESIAGQNSTTIRFHRPLTQYFGENWSDEIFVTLTSSVGPNTVDIIEYLADTYTDLVKDAASFSSVRIDVDPFPSSFAFLDRRATLGAIEDISWQARCVAFVKDKTLFLKFLAKEEASEETINESNIDLQTLQMTLTTTEDLVTEFTAEWDSDYSAERRNRVVLRNNIGKYGTIQEDYDFFIYNVQDLVLKAATFWIIRYSNTWKIAKFKTPLVVLRLDIYDTIDLDFIDDWVASSSVKGVIEDVSYNSDTFELDFLVRTSVRAGELDSYIFTWPASVAVDVEYPTPDDLFAGGATS